MHPASFLTGTSNDLWAQRRCKICPVGMLCPDSGMEFPIICPAGFVCDNEGLAVWSQQCPGGYFCKEGTTTANATSFVSSRPMPCAPGTYCLIGVSTNLSVVGDLSTPQPCVEGTYCWEAASSQRGSAPCPRGHFCPESSSLPIPAAPG
jgi:hypothetical protein